MPHRSVGSTVGFARKGGRLMHVSEVTRGVACGCTCVSCDALVLAKKGARRAHHFAHATRSDCDGGVESILHRLAKEVLSRPGWFTLPAYLFERTRHVAGGECHSFSAKILSACSVTIDRAAVEVDLGPIVPDLVLEREDGRKLLVEITVTHAVDRSKLRHVRNRDLPLLEITLGRADAALSRTELETKLRFDLRCKAWRFHPRQRNAERTWIVGFRRKRSELARDRAWDRSARQSKPLAYSAIRTTLTEYPISTSSAWTRENWQAEQFFRRNGRYPTLAEQTDTFAPAPSAPSTDKKSR